MKISNVAIAFLFLFISVLIFSCSENTGNMKIKNDTVVIDNEKEDCGYYDTIYKKDSLKIFYYSKFCDLKDSIDFRISFGNVTKKFHTHYYHKSFSLDSVLYPYVVLGASCGTECKSYIIFNFETGKSLEYSLSVSIDYKQKILANQSSNNKYHQIGFVNIINFSGDTLKTFFTKEYLTFWDGTVTEIGIDEDYFYFIPTYADTVEGIAFNSGEEVRLKFR